MKSGIIYGGVFLFTFVIVTGLIIFLNSTYENIFQFNFAPKSFVNLSDSTKTDSTQTDSLNIAENQNPLTQIDSTNSQDSVLLSSLAPVETKDSVVTNMVVNKPVKNKPDKIDIKQAVNLPETNSQKTDLTQSLQQNNLQEKNKNLSRKDYDDWLKKISGIYSSMEPKKAAKIIQTYSDNIARDILYNMNKKTAAKVVSELNPETANRIFRFE